MWRYAFILVLVIWGCQGEWVIQLEDGTDPEVFAVSNRLRYVRPVNGLDGYYLFVSNSRKERSFEIDKRLSQAKEALFVERQRPRQRHTRVAPTDPLYWKQWHLHGDATTANVHAEEGWAHGARGEGVLVAIVDDGCNHLSRDLASNYNASASWSFNDDSPEPSPYVTDSHGTAAAGVCCASQNDICGSGVAPEASLSCIKLIAAPSSDLMEAEAMAHDPAIQIYSNSWGPIDSGASLEGPGYLTRMSFRRQAEQNDKVIVWAGGNGRLQRDNGNYDGYANSPHTIAVGAHDHRGQVSWYSEDCACLFVSAPSSGNGRGITTTDLQGHYGATSSDCRSDFGGTSSAAPLVAGIVADLLSLYPGLGWRGVLHTLARGSRVIDPGHSGWTRPNARRYQHSPTYGFGRPELPGVLEAAVRYADGVPPLKKYLSTILTGSLSIAKTHGIPAHISAAHRYQITSFDVDVEFNFVEQVMLHLEYQKYHRGDVRVALVSPAGVVSELALDRPDTGSDTPRGGWRFSSVRHWGEQPRGEWIVRMDDVGRTSTGRLNRAQLEIWGTTFEEE